MMNERFRGSQLSQNNPDEIESIKSRTRVRTNQKGQR